MSRADADRRAVEWARAWNARDLDAVLAHFAEGVTFRSPMAFNVLGQSELRGRPALRAYWERALDHIGHLYFVVERALWDPDARELAVFYTAELDGRRVRACERLRLDDAGYVVLGEALYGAPVSPAHAATEAPMQARTSERVSAGVADTLASRTGGGSQASLGDRVVVFFYGLFMDGAQLRAEGIHPSLPQIASVRDMALCIGERATLCPAAGEQVYGVVTELTRGELTQLYSAPSVAEYRPVVVLAELHSGDGVPALCYTLEQRPGPEVRNAEYAARLAALAARIGLPAAYVARIQ